MLDDHADRPQVTWEVFGRSVRGASHRRSGVPNQDAYRWEGSSERRGASVLLAVADGHGSKKSFRSEQGARFAVRIAAELLREFQDRLVAACSLSEVERTAKIDLPKAVVRRWRQAVEEHHRANPPTAAELDAFRTDADFLKVGSDLLDLMRRQTPDFVKQELEGWLSEASATASGDDVTVGLIYRLDAICPQPASSTPAQSPSIPLAEFRTEQADKPAGWWPFSRRKGSEKQ
ncbi:MAG: protein phosphatase 2C domain-containing protein [Gemmataceae bacterium]|nr:protein phosphatase 2C domain-containing protein [Gemmataceae bacterium]